MNFEKNESTEKTEKTEKTGANEIPIEKDIEVLKKMNDD